MTISSSRPLFRADHDGSSHFARKVLVYVLQHHILRRILIYLFCCRSIKEWHELAKTTPTHFATSAEITHLQDRSAQSLLQWNNSIVPTLASNLDIRINHGRHTLLVWSVSLVYAIGIKETENQCHLEYQWFGGNLRITMMTAIFVWWNHWEGMV